MPGVSKGHNFKCVAREFPASLQAAAARASAKLPRPQQISKRVPRVRCGCLFLSLPAKPLMCQIVAAGYVGDNANGGRECSKGEEVGACLLLALTAKHVSCCCSVWLCAHVVSGLLKPSIKSSSETAHTSMHSTPPFTAPFPTQAMAPLTPPPAATS